MEGVCLHQRAEEGGQAHHDTKTSPHVVVNLSTQYDNENEKKAKITSSRSGLQDYTQG